MSKTSEQVQADLDRVDAAEKGWQDVVERLNQQLAKAGPSERVKLRLELENAKTMLGDMAAVGRVVAAGVPFDELKLPNADRARSRRQRDREIQRQFLRWEQAAREKAAKAEAERIAQIRQEVSEGKRPLSDLTAATTRPETARQTFKREVRENDAALLRQLADEEREFRETHGGRPLRWRGSKALEFLRRGGGLHPEVFKGRESMRLARQEAFEERQAKRSAENESVARLKAAEELSKRRRAAGRGGL